MEDAEPRAHKRLRKKQGSPKPKQKQKQQKVGGMLLNMRCVRGPPSPCTLVPTTAGPPAPGLPPAEQAQARHCGGGVGGAAAGAACCSGGPSGALPAAAVSVAPSAA